MNDIQRDQNGKFKKGVSANPKGRNSRQVERSYLDILIGEVSLEDWRSITRKAVDEAKEGDAVARRWLSDYLLPQPKQLTELSGSLTLTMEQLAALTEEELLKIAEGKS